VSTKVDKRMLLMLGLVAGLGLLVYLDWTGGGTDEETRAVPRPSAPGPSTSRRPAAADPSGQRQHPLAALRLDELAETTARPLFEPTRRPPSPPPRVAPPPPKPQVAAPLPVAPPPSYRLVGVVADPSRPVAVLTGGAGRKPHRVQVGDVVDGWQVMRIAPTEVAIENNGREVVFRMFKK
jgi:general secretion pathway protein N